MKYQRGAGIISILVALIVFVGALVVSLRLMPLYKDNWAIAQIFQEIQKEAEDASLDRLEVNRRIDRRFIINGVDDLKEHVEIHGQGSVIRLEMNYERRVPLTANIELAVTFTHNVIISE